MTADMEILAPEAPVATCTSPPKGTFKLAEFDLESVVGAPACELPAPGAPGRAELRATVGETDGRDEIIERNAVEKIVYEPEELPVFNASEEWTRTAVQGLPRGMIEKGPFFASVAERIVHDGVAAYRALPEVVRRPRHLAPIDAPPRGLPPDDLLVCTVYIRGLDRDAQGRLQPRADLAQRNAGPQRDFLWLTADEWRSLVPEQPAVGQTTSVPFALTDRIARFYLNNGTAGMRYVWTRRELREAELTLTVEAADATGTALRLDGTVRLANRRQEDQASRRAVFHLHGRLHHDASTQRFDRFDLLALGEELDERAVALGDLNKHYFDPSGRATLGIAFRLCSPAALGYGTPPGPIRFGHRRELEDYFGTSDLEPGLLAYFELDE